MSALTASPSAAIRPQTRRFFEALAAERDALTRFLERGAGPQIAPIIDAIAAQTKPLIVIGIGKSGHIAAKTAATFSSLDIPAIYLNAAEAAHGDLGIVEPQSAVVVFSNSGVTEEIMRLIPLLCARNCTIIAITGNKSSPLASIASYVVHAEIAGEVDTIGMAPTASTTLQLAIGDALAVAVSEQRGITREAFVRHHPAGLLGRQLVPIANLMRQGDDLPKVERGTPLLELLSVMSAKRIGAACVVDKDDQLLGLVVDGDVRRCLQKGGQMGCITASDVMKVTPHTVQVDFSLGHVLSLQKRADIPWLVMPVVDGKGRLQGILHAQDILG